MRPSKQLWIDRNACFLRLPPLELVSLCVYGEARGESTEGRLAVMNVIRNRMRHFGRYCDKDIQRCGLGKEFHCIILKKWQFACFNLGDPNRQKLINMAADVQREVRCNKTVASIYAMSIFFNDMQDNTDGATLYHYKGMATFPAWTLSDKVTMTKEIGNHIFYREE
jgi:N-acetylmuramoyl-L-alanine amidase